jgi:hypothetical protein
MKTILKAKLKRNPLTSDPDDFYVQVLLNGSVGVEGIIEEMLKENNDIDPKMALNIITLFNKKTTECIASGKHVNTGLVSFNPVIKGALYKKVWNPKVNRVDVNISRGFELSKALIETNIQIIEEHGDVFDVISQNKQRLVESVDYKDELLDTASEPACGMAFRRWLCNS